MFFKITSEVRREWPEGLSDRVDGRFVLHRHRDEEGPHLDLRLEQDGHLMGWRIDATTLEEEAWGVEKGPHSVRWLEQDGDAVREDAGTYLWVERSRGRKALWLRGERGLVFVRVEQQAGLPAHVVRAVAVALNEAGASADEAARLVVDGLTARGRAISRLCGLGRELDGAAFDEGVWRRALAGLSLDEIHAQLRAYEVRFDAKYPPLPVSRPERLEGEREDTRRESALTIARE